MPAFRRGYGNSGASRRPFNRGSNSTFSTSGGSSSSGSESSRSRSGYNSSSSGGSSSSRELRGGSSPCGPSSNEIEDARAAFQWFLGQRPLPAVALATSLDELAVEAASVEEGEVVTGDAVLQSADASNGNGSFGADPTHQMDAALNLAMLETLSSHGSCEEAAFDALNDAIRLAEGMLHAHTPLKLARLERSLLAAIIVLLSSSSGTILARNDWTSWWYLY